jgi:phosphoenolpyruvate carboxykinase (GTP)
LFSVNWFRKDANGRFIWPGFGENSRVLDWIIRRLEGKAEAIDTPIGRVPAPGELDFDGLDVPQSDRDALFEVNTDSWRAEADLTAEYFAKFGDRVPSALHEQLQALRARLA